MEIRKIENDEKAKFYEIKKSIMRVIKTREKQDSKVLNSKNKWPV